MHLAIPGFLCDSWRHCARPPFPLERWAIRGEEFGLGEVYPMNDGRDADSWHEFVARAASPVEPAAYADFTTMRFDNMPVHPPEIGGDETSWPLNCNGSGFAVVGIWRNRDARRRIRTAAFYG
jgi:hypothetical protein